MIYSTCRIFVPSYFTVSIFLYFLAEANIYQPFATPQVLLDFQSATKPMRAACLPAPAGYEDGEVYDVWG